MWYKYKIDYYSDLKNEHWNYEISSKVPKMMDLQGKDAKRNQQQRKKIADVLEGETEN